MLTDPDGTLPFLAITAAIGAVVGAVAGAAIGYAATGTVKGALVGAGVGAVGGALVGLGVGAGLGMISGAGALATASQVGAGLATLATVAGDKIAAGVNKVSNAISSVGNKASPAASKMADVAAKGKAGEVLSGIEKNTKHIVSLTQTAAYRIPDGLGNGILHEVKNYSGTLYYTNQLKDFVMYSQANNLQMYLHTNAKLCGDLQGLVDGGVIQLFPLG